MANLRETIRPSADLRNHYNEISKQCREGKEAVIITVNGRGDTVSLSYEEYKNMKSRIELLEILSGKRVCDQCKNQIHHCDKCCIKKLSWKICHYPGICKVLKSDFSWQCQNVVHICWILDGNHQCHIKRQQDDKYDSNDQKDRNRPVVTLFYFHCILFHPNFSSLFSSTRSWNTEISTTTTKSITALAD